MESPELVHIPHSSLTISEHDLRDFLATHSEIRYELIRLTDWYTDELFGQAWDPQNVLQFQHSRLVVDVERFVSDHEEPCAEVGMGATYTKTTQGNPLRNLTAERRHELIQDYYIPHHQIFTKKVFKILEKFGRCIILDGHSYPTDPLPTQTNYNSTPEIGIGTDALFTSPQLVDLTLNYFQSHGFEVGLNQPFTGAIVPSEIYQSRDTRVQSVMIEVRRDLYIDEKTAEKRSQFEKIKKLIHSYRQLVSDTYLTE
jgi:N-formylglutamate amidohydrolase